MAIFTINKEALDYSIDNTSIVTDCSSSYFYDVAANQSDSIDIVLSGNHEGAYYTLNGVKVLFTDTASGIVFNNSLVIGFFLKNSGDAGQFHTCDVQITNNNSTSTNPTFSYQEIRQNDNVDCDDAILTVDNGAQDNHVAVFTGPNGLEGTDDLTYDGTTLDVTGQVIGTSIAVDGGTSSQFLKADGSVDSNTYLTIPPTGGFIDGTGTAGKLPKFTDFNTVEDSIITEDSSKIGIGVVLPKAALHVNGAVIIGDDQSTASADLVGALRYWDETGGEFGSTVTARVDICVKNACGYQWVNIVTNITQCY